MAKNTMGMKLPRKLEQKMQIVEGLSLCSAKEGEPLLVSPSTMGTLPRYRDDV